MATWLYRANLIAEIVAFAWWLRKPATAVFAIAANAVKNSIGAEFPNATAGEKMKKIDVYGLTPEEIHELRLIAKERYGKASVSLLAKKLLQAELNHFEPLHQENNIENKRFNLRLPLKHHIYIAQKATLQHSSLNDVVRDIIAEHITENPVLSNDDVQALYQSNYQLLRLGRNINQLARQFNAILPQSITTQQLNEIANFLAQHTEKVGKVLQQQGKSFKYRPIRD